MVPLLASGLNLLKISSPPLGTIPEFISQLQMVVFGPRCEGRLCVRVTFANRSATQSIVPSVGTYLTDYLTAGTIGRLCSPKQRHG